MSFSRLMGFGVGIVGAGLIGHKRATALRGIGGARLVAVADTDFRQAKELAKAFGVEAVSGWTELVSRDDVDVVIVAVPNKFAPAIVVEALRNKKHVLCEKPFGRNAGESRAMLAAAKKYKRAVKVGFNLRFHPGIFKAKQLFNKGAIGKPLLIRARYGHGGRLGMEKEWRFQKEISGGGELLDQGVHIVDLARWFVGEFGEVHGVTETKFWRTDLEDNAFAILRNKKVTVSFHVSTTNWKNTFSLEIFGDLGYLAVDGLGGSYGLETLTVGKRKVQFGVPKVKVFKFSSDVSWRREWENFMSAIRGGKSEIADGVDGYEANRIVEALYRSSETGKVVNL